MYSRTSRAVSSGITRSLVLTRTGTGSDSARKLPTNSFANVKSLITTSRDCGLILTHTFCTSARTKSIADLIHCIVGDKVVPLRRRCSSTAEQLELVAGGGQRPRRVSSSKPRLLVGEVGLRPGRAP